MNPPSLEEEKQIKELGEKIFDVLFDKHNPRRHIVIKSILTALLMAIHEMQAAEYNVTKQSLSSVKTPEKSTKRLVNESHMNGLKSKMGQIIMLLIGNIGDRRSRKDQIEIINQCKSYISEIRNKG